MENIVTTHKNVGQLYFDDASVEWACPPLKALLHIMVHGEFEGKDLANPELRALFTKESMLASSWYQERLVAKQKHSVALWRKHARYLEKFLARPTHLDEAKRLGIQERLSMAMGKQQYFESAKYLEDLKGTLGLTPLPA